MIGAQNRIINLQSEIIDGLYMLLSQHLSAEDIQSLPEIGKMSVAVGLRKNLEGDV
ncbi:MAG: hypothetical protein LUG61_11250 [Lachnospiraceae bacterium]|nr:hypothetical protein [Lachnospiraceae bacterium]